MSIVTTREQRRQMARNNAKLPKHLELVPPADWQHCVANHAEAPVAVWRSRTFLVQKYLAPAPAIALLSVLRTTLDSNGENLVRGLEHLREDLENGKISLSDFAAFELG